MKVQGKQGPVLVSDSDDDQRVPDTLEKARPQKDELVDLTSDAQPERHDGEAAAALRLSQGKSQIPHYA